MSRVCGRRERGQSQLEYIGLLILVGALVAVLVASGVGAALAGGFRVAICRVVHPLHAATCGATPRLRAGSMTPMTPLERATQGGYVALGDSYSSGAGGTEFAPGTDQDVSRWESFQEIVESIIPFWENDLPAGRNMCHRSTEAYAQRIYDAYEFGGDLVFHACSGANIADLLPDYQDQGGSASGDDPGHATGDEPPQLQHLTVNTSLVTISIGGNDVAFAQVITACFVTGLLDWRESCQESMGATMRRKIRNIEDDLVGLYDRIQQRAPNARVLVVGYPRMFPESPRAVGPSLEVGDLDEPIDPADQRWLNEMARLLNETIKEAALEAGVEFVNVVDALDGHEIGTRHSWINDLDPELENGKPWDMGSFHPNDRGQAAIARLVKQQLRNRG